MSELIIDNENNKGRINNVTFCYVKLQEGAYKYQSKTEREYTVDCVVDKATAKAYKKVFPKNGYREIDTQDFEGIFKIAPIFPESDEQLIIKLKANAQVKRDISQYDLEAGDSVPYEWASRPKAYVPIERGVEDITMLKLIRNGSTGDVAFNITTNDFGTFPQLTAILVKNLIEYKQKGLQSEFGEVVGGFNSGDGETQQKADAGDNKDNTEFGEQGSHEPSVEDSDGDPIPF
jgi:hypothetical protein